LAYMQVTFKHGKNTAHRANGMIELQHKCTESGEVHEVSTLEQTLSMMHAWGWNHTGR